MNRNAMYSHVVFCFQAEDGIRYLVRSRGLGDVYKRQVVVGEDDSPCFRRLMKSKIKTFDDTIDVRISI